MGLGPQDRGAAPEERRQARCALILVDLDADDSADVDAAAERWGQSVRFALSDVPGVAAAMVRARVLPLSSDDVIAAMMLTAETLKAT